MLHQMEAKTTSDKKSKKQLNFGAPVDVKPSRRDNFIVDISRGLVRVTKTSKTGVILSAGQAPFTSSQLSSQDLVDNQFPMAVAGAMKQACLRAGIKPGSKKAVFLIGDAYVVSRLFTWPNIPYAALRANVELEIATYLPHSTSQYVISYEVQKSYYNDEGLPVVDVLVAAVPVTDIVGITAAAKLAGIVVERIDVRENARLKAVSFYLDKGSAPFKSYVVLDVSRPQICLTICLNGQYYEKRYFGSDGRPEHGTSASFSPRTHVDVHESNDDEIIKDGISNSERFWGLSLSRFDSDTLTQEVTAMIDFINYHERATPLEGLLLIDPAGRLLTKMENALPIPVHDLEKFVRPELVSKGMYGYNVSPVLDACGANLLTNQATYKQMINVNMGAAEIMLSTIITRAALLVAVFAAIVFFTIIRPLSTERQLTRDYESLAAEIERKSRAVLPLPAIQEEIEVLREIYHETVIDPPGGFLAEIPQALGIIPFIFEIDGLIVRNVDASPTSITISGNVTDIYSFTVLADYLMNSGLFQSLNLVDAFETYVYRTDVDIHGVETQHWTTNFRISLDFYDMEDES